MTNSLQTLILIKESFIQKIKNKYRVVSRKGKNLGEYDTKGEALKRLREIEFFKHKKASKQESETELTYAAVIRQLTKNNSSDLSLFRETYKKIFDALWMVGEEEPETFALIYALQQLKENPLVKNAAFDLGSVENAAENLAKIIRFLMRKISDENRPKSLLSLKHKLLNLDSQELSAKKMPASSAMGQSITIVKHLLMGQQSPYIRAVLEQLSRVL